MRQVRLLSTGHVAGLGAGDVLSEDDPRFAALVRMYPHSVEEVRQARDEEGRFCRAEGERDGDGEGEVGEGGGLERPPYEADEGEDDG